MNKGTRVSFQIAGASMPGFGEVVSDEVNGKVLVAVDSMSGERFPGYHPVISCAVSSLTNRDFLAEPGIV